MSEPTWIADPTPPLALWVGSHSCVCGNKWTHSYVTHVMGGMPTASILARGQITVMHELMTRIHNHCHRCLQLTAGIGWTKPQTEPLLPASLGAAPKRNAKRPFNLSDLEDSL